MKSLSQHITESQDLKLKSYIVTFLGSSPRAVFPATSKFEEALTMNNVKFTRNKQVYTVDAVTKPRHAETIVKQVAQHNKIIVTKDFFVTKGQEIEVEVDNTEINSEPYSLIRVKSPSGKSIRIINFNKNWSNSDVELFNKLAGDRKNTTFNTVFSITLSEMKQLAEMSKRK